MPSVTILLLKYSFKILFTPLGLWSRLCSGAVFGVGSGLVSNGQIVDCLSFIILNQNDELSFGNTTLTIMFLIVLVQCIVEC